MTCKKTIFLILMIIAICAEDPVDKLFEFQQLMKQKTKIPSTYSLILEQQMSEYDSSDIFSEGYITVDEQYDEYEIYEEEYEDDDMEELQQQQEKQMLEQLELQRLESQRLEQLRIEQQRLEQQKIEQQRLEQQRLEQQRLEQQKLEQQKQELELQKKKQLIEIPEQWTDEIDEEPVVVKKKKKSNKKPQDDDEIIDYLNTAKKTKVQEQDFEEIEKKIVKKRRRREEVTDEFVQKVPAQNQTFIHFNNKNNNLELAPCSNNPIQQRACSLCKSEVGYQLDDDNWYMIGLQHGYKKEFLLLIEITKQSFGDSQLYLSFQSNGSACMTSDSLKQEIEVETVLQRFSGKSWRHFIKNEQFALPASLEGRSFQFKATYQNKQFVFTDFEVKFQANLSNQLKSKSSDVSIKTNTVEFVAEQVFFKIKQMQCTLSGVIKQQSDELPYLLNLFHGEATSQLEIPNCQIPLHNELLYGVSDMYFGEYFKESLQSKLIGNFRAHLNATTSFENGKLKVRFAMKKQL